MKFEYISKIPYCIFLMKHKIQINLPMIISLFVDAFLLLAHLSRMLKVSYCDRSSSGVRRQSSVELFYIFVFFFKTHNWILTKLGRNDP